MHAFVVQATRRQTSIVSARRRVLHVLVQLLRATSSSLILLLQLDVDLLAVFQLAREVLYITLLWRQLCELFAALMIV